VTPTPLADVLGAPVETAGTRVGVVADVYADPAEQHVIGVEVIGATGRRWYLPWAAAVLTGRRLQAASPLVFMPLDQVTFYIEHGVRLEPRDLDGIAVDATGALSRSPAIVSDAEREGTGVA
jgi:PRC-barrel domain